MHVQRTSMYGNTTTLLYWASVIRRAYIITPKKQNLRYMHRWSHTGNWDSNKYLWNFEPTQTWKWLNSTDDYERSTEQSLDDDENAASYDDRSVGSPYDGGFQEEGVDEDEQAKEEPTPERSNQRAQAIASLECGFDCRCKRCLDEQN